MVVFAFRSLHDHAGEAPLPMLVWVPLVSSSLAWSVGLFSVFLLRQSGLMWKLPKRLIIGAVVARTAVLFLFPQSYFAENRTLLFYVPIAIVGIACIVFVCIRTILRPERDQILLALALLMIVPPTINDLAWIVGALPFETVLLLPVAMPTVLFAISATVATATLAPGYRRKRRTPNSSDASRLRAKNRMNSMKRASSRNVEKPSRMNARSWSRICMTASAIGCRFCLRRFRRRNCQGSNHCATAWTICGSS